MNLSGFSRYVKLSEISNNQITLHIERPFENMQTDYACFESIALILKIREGSEQITLSFDEIYWNGTFSDLTSEQVAYMRFLYRAHKFESAFAWFNIKSKNRTVVYEFIDRINSISVSCNIPNSNASYNPNKGIEHQIENEFADLNKKQTYFMDLFKTTTGKQLNCVYNQFPNGVFADKVTEKTRIFPTGFFDLWGMTDDELCIFELKNNTNKQLGIISELFFYSVYAKEFLIDKKCYRNSSTNFRGFQTMTNAIENGCNKVNAYFLTDGIHSLITPIKTELLKYLNQVDKDIEFSFINYNQDEVI